MPALLLADVSGATYDVEDLWDRLLVERGWYSTPSGPADAYRTRSGPLPADLSGPGAPLGKGYETFAIMQVVDTVGRRTGPLAFGFFDKGGADDHAEACALKAFAPTAAMRGGTLMVVVDQTVCPSCVSKLIDWAGKAGVQTVAAFLPTRKAVRGNGTVSPKTAARTAVMARRPDLQFIHQGIKG